MIINNLLDCCHLDDFSAFRKNEPMRVNQINRILLFPVALKFMTPANRILNHFLNRRRGTDFIDALMNDFRHAFAVFPDCGGGVRAYLFYLLIAVFNIQTYLPHRLIITITL